MKITKHECVHCGTPYRFVASGFVEEPKINDKTYCPDCMRAILKTLDSIPKKFEHRHIVVNDVTIEELKKAQESLPKQVGGFGNATKCFPELYDTKLNEWTKTSEIPYNYKKYRLCEYPNGIHKITKEVIWDIQNDKEYKD